MLIQEAEEQRVGPDSRQEMQLVSGAGDGTAPP